MCKKAGLRQPNDDTHFHGDTRTKSKTKMRLTNGLHGMECERKLHDERTRGIEIWLDYEASRAGRLGAKTRKREGWVHSPSHQKKTDAVTGGPSRMSGGTRGAAPELGQV